MKKINQKNFKKAMSKFPTGVTIVSINSDNNYIGKTVNSFASLSLKPPLILFSLDKKSSSINQFVKAKFIGISFLKKSQKKLSIHFAKKKCEWGHTKFFLSKNNIPLIKDSVINLECEKKINHKEGDHIIFICKVRYIESSSKKNAMIYYDNKYM